MEAGLELVNFLIDIKFRGSLAARHVCIISYWATRAGCAGPISGLARHPSTHSGGFSRHFDKVVGSSPATALPWYELEIPRYLRADGTRTVEP
eukprot:13722155-Alexandrium_andersonii.AAC.1